MCEPDNQDNPGPLVLLCVRNFICILQMEDVNKVVCESKSGVKTSKRNSMKAENTRTSPNSVLNQCLRKLHGKTKLN